MRDGERLEQQAFLFQILKNKLVGVLAERAGERRAFGHVAAVVHHLHERQVVFSAHSGVVLAERRRNVHYARAFVERDVAVGNDAVSVLHALIARVKRLVGKPLVVRAFLFLDDGVLALVEKDVNALFRENKLRALALDFNVVVIGVHAKRHVGRKRPWRSRPGENVGFLLALDLKGCDGGLFLHVLIALCDFVRRKRRAAARTIGNDFVSLVDESAVENVFERPPLRLDIIVVVGNVWVFHVHPIAHAVGHFLPLGLVLPHALFALLNKRLDAVLLDVLLAVHAELFLHLELDGQTVSVPAGFARGVIALHRLEARNNILHDARENMTDMRLAVCGGRSVIERKLFAVLGLFQRFLENAIFFPEFQHFLFSFHEVHIRIDFLVHKPLLP